MIDTGPAALAVRGPNVIINELMINPHKVYDSRGEWIELYNAGTIAAPGGGIQISGAEVHGGQLVGGNVQLSGSSITLS